MMRTILIVPITALLLGCVPVDGQPQGRATLADARPSGEAVDCIEVTDINHTRVIDDRTVDFHMRNNIVYRNRLPNACPALELQQAFSYEPALSRLCSTDTITVRSAGVPGATCGLGAFQPIEGVVQ